MSVKACASVALAWSASILNTIRYYQLAWYVGGTLIATGAECKCAAGETVECRLEA